MSPLDHELIAMSEFNAEISAEMQPPAEQKPVKKRKTPEGKSAQGGKRGQPRPYRKLDDEILTTRISKLTARLERAKKQVTRASGRVRVGDFSLTVLPQHEDAKRLLTRYSYEKTVRLRDTLAAVPVDLAGGGETAVTPDTLQSL